MYVYKWHACPGVVLCNILPAALYGCEAAHVNKTALNALRSAIASAIGPASAKRNVNLVFTNTRCAKDLDPAAHILYLRVAGIRRIMAKYTEEEKTIRLIVQKYNTKNVNSPPGNIRAFNQSIWPSEPVDDKSEIEHDYGPIGFLLTSLKSCGCSMSDDLIIRSENEPDIDLWNMPWQHLKTAIINIATRQRTRNITGGKNARTFCGTLGEIDEAIVKKLVNNMAPKESNVYTHLSTGAFWNECQLHDIHMSDGLCYHCKQPVEDSSHITWGCPCVNQHRKHTKLANFDWKILPKSILNGIPPALSRCLSGAFWEGGPTKKEEVSSVADAEMIGIPIKRIKQHIAEGNDLLFNKALVMQSIPIEGLNARQAFQQLKQCSYKDAIMPTPYRCVIKAPDKINAYSDGSWLHPLKQYLGIGGAGVWWPGRSLCRSENGLKFIPLSNCESEMTYSQQTAEGVRLYTKIGGHNGSSTRTELAAGIIAICAHGPVHIGSDSKAFVDTANRMMNDIAKKRNPSKK